MRPCKAVFWAAQRRKLLTDNPFADLVSAVRGNPSRLYFVTRDEAGKVLDACPDAEWRLLFALARFGGVRTPSESLALKWGDVDWENNRIRVPSPKTEHIEGKESRPIPMFPELRPHLEAVFDQAEPGTEYVINRYRGGNVNLRDPIGTNHPASRRYALGQALAKPTQHAGNGVDGGISGPRGLCLDWEQ